MAKLLQVAPGTWYLLIHVNNFYSCPTPLLSFWAALTSVGPQQRAKQIFILQTNVKLGIKSQVMLHRLHFIPESSLDEVLNAASFPGSHLSEIRRCLTQSKVEPNSKLQNPKELGRALTIMVFITFPYPSHLASFKSLMPRMYPHTNEIRIPEGGTQASVLQAPQMIPTSSHGWEALPGPKSKVTSGWMFSQ